MYLEFEISIKEVIKSVEFKNRLLELAEQAIVELQQKEEDKKIYKEQYSAMIAQHDFSKTVFSVEKCPKNIDAHISSNV